MLNLIYNDQIKRIIDLMSNESLNLLKTNIRNNKIIKTKFKIKINKFTFLCEFYNDDVYITAFRYSRNNFNVGNNIAEINIIENHFLDQNIHI